MSAEKAGVDRGNDREERYWRGFLGGGVVEEGGCQAFPDGCWVEGIQELDR